MFKRPWWRTPIVLTIASSNVSGNIPEGAILLVAGLTNVRRIMKAKWGTATKFRARLRPGLRSTAENYNGTVARVPVVQSTGLAELLSCSRT
jgi:hypothetical protein